MRRHKYLTKGLLGLSALLAGGTVLGNGCANTLMSITPCGTVFTFCTPADQANLLFPYMEIPDFTSDPSCTIPRGCGNSDLLPPFVGGPGGSGSNQPSGGGGGGGGGGGF